MADLNVQPKKGGSILPWILLGLGLIALLIFLARGCNDDDKNAVEEATSATTNNTGNAGTATTATDAEWGNIDFNAPRVTYDEITNSDIEVRGNDQYAVYGISENILFDEGKSTIRPQAEKTLQEVAGSIGKRYTTGNMRVYGHTDSKGDAASNKQLAEQRAEAVRAWLSANGKVDAGRISVHPVGESQPVASNNTEAGRQQNRRVEIVVRGK